MFKFIELSDLITDEVLRRSLIDYEEQLVWIFTGWSIEIIFIDWMVEITRSLFEKYLSENWWAKICSHKLLMILTEEFDHGSDWTLAAGLTHASRAGKSSLLLNLAADGWVILRNLPNSGGQHLERDANTAYALRGKAGDLRTLR